MKFSHAHRVLNSAGPEPNWSTGWKPTTSASPLMPVDEDAIVFEIAATYGPSTKPVQITATYEPSTERVRQYVCEIREDPEGDELIDALSGALDSFRDDRGSPTAKFTLWIKGRRFGNFSLAPNDHSATLNEIYHIVDLEIAFNRHEWGCPKPA